MNVSERTGKTLLILSAVLIVALFTYPAWADRSHHGHDRVTEVINVTEVVNVTERVDVIEVINSTNIDNYTADPCQGVAIAQAGANNMMFAGTHKPQLSLGIGECGGNAAGSLMFGMKPCKNCPLINGSMAVDEDVEAYGIGATIIFK